MTAERRAHQFGDRGRRHCGLADARRHLKTPLPSVQAARTTAADRSPRCATLLLPPRSSRWRPGLRSPRRTACEPARQCRSGPCRRWRCDGHLSRRRAAQRDRKLPRHAQGRSVRGRRYRRRGTSRPPPLHNRRPPALELQAHKLNAVRRSRRLLWDGRCWAIVHRVSIRRIRERWPTAAGIISNSAQPGAGPAGMLAKALTSSPGSEVKSPAPLQPSD